MGFEFLLSWLYAGSTTTLQLQLKSPVLPRYGPDFPHLTVTVEQQTRERLHVVIRAADTPRWEVPQHLIPRWVAEGGGGGGERGAGGEGGGEGEGEEEEGEGEEGEEEEEEEEGKGKEEEEG